MSNEVVLKIEKLSKQYRLGLVGTGTISHDLNRFFAKLRGKEDPYLRVGETNDRSKKGKTEYVWALKDISFDVRKGEVLGIIGKNGAGKSTLLKILSKVTGPTTGVIKSKGRIASLLEVGTGFHPEMTGRENIFLNGAILGMTKNEITNKLEDIIEFSGCERYIDTPVKRYSSGMKVRLAFAVAAFLEPDILVVDEVLAVGDAEFQKKAIGKMQDISNSSGRTVLFVSHDMAAVQSLCNRIVVMKNGTICYIGGVQEAIQEYLKGSKVRVDFSSIKDRKGTGVIKIIEGEVYGEVKNSKPQIGKPFHLELVFENKNKINTSDVRIDIRIDDALGQKIVWMSNSLLEFNYEEEPINRVLFSLNKLNLNKGQYHITTYVEVKGDVSDWVQNAMSFEVVEGDFYGTSKLVPREQSKVLVNFNVEYVL